MFLSVVVVVCVALLGVVCWLCLLLVCCYRLLLSIVVVDCCSCVLDVYLWFGVDCCVLIVLFGLFVCGLWMGCFGSLLLLAVMCLLLLGVCCLFVELSLCVVYCNSLFMFRCR